MVECLATRKQKNQFRSQLTLMKKLWDKFPFMGERGGRERRNDHILKKYEGQHISKMSLIYTFCDFQIIVVPHLNIFLQKRPKLSLQLKSMNSFILY